MTEIKPWRVGETAVYVVGVEGPITALGEDTITINGLTLPTRLNRERGIRYLSMVWPDEPQPCHREHVDDQHSEEDPERERIEDLVRMVQIEHEAHGESMRFCSHAMCRIASEHIEEATA